MHTAVATSPTPSETDASTDATARPRARRQFSLTARNTVPRIRCAPNHAELVSGAGGDQGPEMRDWKQVHVDAGIDVFFCDPHAPWQRGSNQNTNGLLR
jgi:IS30 family transposase